jgi:hypothetical protein
MDFQGVSFSSTPFPSLPNTFSSSYVCSASRLHNGLRENLFIRLEW